MLSLQNNQTNDYWKNAPINRTNIYSVYFVYERNGYAISYENKPFQTTDNGVTWNIKETGKMPEFRADEFFWSGEIYCSAMETTDGGINWVPYTSGVQEHFCRVYMKDPNVDYKTASEFLNTVTSKILLCITNEDITSIANKPQQCAEYYTNENEGWALGWCLRNFKMN